MPQLNISLTEKSEKQLLTLNKVTKADISILKDKIKDSIMNVLLWTGFNINRWLSYDGVRILKLSSDWNKVILKLRFPCEKGSDKKWSKKKCRVVIYLDRNLYQVSVLYVYNKEYIKKFFNVKRRDAGADMRIVEEVIKKDYSYLLRNFS